MKKFIYFSAPWCGPCRMFGPTMDRVAQSGIVVEKVNIDENKDLAMQYNVKSIPTTVLVENGNEISRFVGVKPEFEIKQIHG